MSCGAIINGRDSRAEACETAATRTDGASLDVEEAHVLTIDDGRITNLWDLPDDPEAHDRFFDGV